MTNRYINITGLIRHKAITLFDYVFFNMCCFLLLTSTCSLWVKRFRLFLYYMKPFAIFDHVYVFMMSCYSYEQLYVLWYTCFFEFITTTSMTSVSPVAILSKNTVRFKDGVPVSFD